MRTVLKYIRNKINYKFKVLLVRYSNDLLLFKFLNRNWISKFIIYVLEVK